MVMAIMRVAVVAACIAAAMVAAVASAHSHSELGHSCIHDEIEEIMGPIREEMEREKERQYMGAGLPPSHLRSETRRLRQELGIPAGRRLPEVAVQYHNIRIKFDFSRILWQDGQASPDTSKTSGVDLMCYPGGPDSVQLSSGGSFVSCSKDHELTVEKRDYLVYSLLAEAKAFFGETLQVMDSAVPSTLSLYSGRINCGLQTFYIGCSETPFPELLHPDTDFVLFVTARPTSGSTIAWATYMDSDQYDRPIAGHANFGPARIDTSASAAASQLATAVHEISHALGFSSNKFSKFRLPDNGAPRGSSNIIKEFPGERGYTVRKIITETVVAKVKEHFGCDNYPDIGGEIEDGGGGGTAGSHWEKRVFMNEFMTGTASSDPVMPSAVTLALFQDMGWYKVNFAKAVHLGWGFKQGCSFIRDKCSTGWSTKYFCDTSSQSGCSPDNFKRGYCSITSSWGSAIPSHFQYFAESGKGGYDQYADFCPFFQGYSNGDCRSSSTSARSVYGERRQYMNSNARCFTGTVRRGTSAFHTSCHEVSCASDLQTYTVKFWNADTGSEFVASCPTGGGPVTVRNGNYEGSINCAPASQICFERTGCPNECSGHGTCSAELSCDCATGYHGEDCSMRKCPADDSDVECAGHGSCDTSAGRCTCEAGYDGLNCARKMCGGGGNQYNGRECHGHGACDSSGECVCDEGFTGTTCDVAPGCGDYFPVEIEGGCSGHGMCSKYTGACACDVLPDNLQSNGGDDCRDDPMTCLFYTGLNCTEQTTLQGASQMLQRDVQTQVHGAAKTYQYFYVDVDDSSYDLAILLTVENGTNGVLGDADLYASFENFKPDSKCGEKCWSSTGTGTEYEVVQMCGAFGYDQGPRAGSAGLPGIVCRGQDPNYQKGRLYIGVLAFTDVNYNVTIKSDPCTEVGDCSGHGVCQPSTGTCACSNHLNATGHALAQTAWSGTDCSSPKCLSPTTGPYAGFQCSDHGDCVLSSEGVPTCRCRAGWEPTDPLCESPPKGQANPLMLLNGSNVFDEGESFSVTGLGQGEFQTFSLDVQTPVSAFHVTATPSRSSSSIGSGEPDLMLFARKGDIPSPDFRDYSLFDADSWMLGRSQGKFLVDAGDVGSTKGIWYFKVYNSMYARADMNVKFNIRGTSSSSEEVVACDSGLPENFRTCSGHGQCRVGGSLGVCSCDAHWEGEDCSVHVTSIPTVGVLRPGMYSVSNLALDPEEWAYFRVSAENITDVTAIKVELEMHNVDETLTDGLLLVRPVSAGSLPGLDSNSLYDLAGKSVLLERSASGLAQLESGAGYFVGVHCQRFAKSPLRYSLHVKVYREAEVKTCASDNPCAKGNGRCVDDSVSGRHCLCNAAWQGATCASPVPRDTQGLTFAAQDIQRLTNNGKTVVSLRRGQFKIFRIPQPLQQNKGLELTVCDTSQYNESSRGGGERNYGDVQSRRLLRFLNANGEENVQEECCQGAECSDADIYITTQLPRSHYDFSTVGASPNGTETLTITERSTTGRYWLAVYANNDGEFLIRATPKSVASGGQALTESSFLVEVGRWLLGTTAGNVTFIAGCILMSLICCGCFVSICCTHENLKASEERGGAMHKTATYLGLTASPRPSPTPPRARPPKAGTRYSASNSENKRKKKKRNVQNNRRRTREQKLEMVKNMRSEDRSSVYDNDSDDDGMFTNPTAVARVSAPRRPKGKRMSVNC
eukprot:g4285.t1